MGAELALPGREMRKAAGLRPSPQDLGEPAATLREPWRANPSQDSSTSMVSRITLSTLNMGERPAPGDSCRAEGPSACLVVVGPTASGKSDLAIRLAERLGGEIVSFDSIQAYRHFDIGSAKTPVGQRRGVPHHLLDHVAPDQGYSAGEFARDARTVLDRLKSRGILPVLAGGTGLYLEALLRGLFEGPTEDPLLRQRLRHRAVNRPDGYLWRILARVDAESAARLHANDTPKIIRAIEVSLLGGRPMAEQWRDPRKPLDGFDVLCLGLTPPREALYERIKVRTRRMFADGLAEETRQLLGEGVPRTARPFGALGYAQCVCYVDGQCSLEEAVESAVVETRRYAKRQLTWFRNRLPEARWWNGFGDTEEAFGWAETEFRKGFPYRQEGD